MFLIDPKTKKKSVSLTAFVTGFMVALFKMVFSGVTVGSVILAPFTGMEFAAVVGALGAIYWARRNK